MIFFFLAQDVIRDVESEIRSRMDKDPLVDNMLFDNDAFKAKIARKVFMDFNYGEYSGDIQRAITDYKQGNKMTSAFLQYKSLSMQDYGSKEYNDILKIFNEEGIYFDDEVQHMVMMFARADDQNITK